MKPMASQSASHLASLVTLSTQTWAKLSPQMRLDFASEFKLKQHITLRSSESFNGADKNFKELSIKTPFFKFFKKEVQQHLGKGVSILEEQKPDLMIWVKVPLSLNNPVSKLSHYTIVYAGFSHDVIGPNPPMVVFIVIILGAILVIFSSLFLVNYLVKPINNLLLATKQLGQGTLAQAISESGPQELILLTRSFNTMNTQIQELLQNRTVLLAGISHDLRTPIARTSLALEMLNEKQDQSLIQGIKNDLDEMTQLIQRTLDFSKGLDLTTQEVQSVDIYQYMQNYIQVHPHTDLITFTFDQLKSSKGFQLILSTSVLDRILNNLIENAINYGHQTEIEIKLVCQLDTCHIHILDQGKGIDEDKLAMVFQPFYRLEVSRNSKTGGSGLGLAIVQQLCKAQGWKIKLKNRKSNNLETSSGLEAILSLAQ
jgi:two-component system osmolarity sensor histidine kinase EnvZ